MKTLSLLALAGVALTLPVPLVSAAPQASQVITSITAGDPSPGARFGTDVAIDGDLIVAGAWGDAGFRGSAYVFRGTAGDVTQEAKLVRAGGVANDLFGRTVDVSGETVVVGASRALGAEGRVIVFENTSSPASWTEVAALGAMDLSPGDELGLRVAIDGDTIVAGAPTQAAFRGAAYVYRKVGGVWSQEAKLLGSGVISNDLFGIDVCIFGDRILVGACGASVNRGEVFVFERSGSTWVQADTITAQAPLAGDLFGISVAFDGTRAVCGASRNAGGTAVGFADVYRFLNGELYYEDTLDSPGGANTGFGNRLDVAGEFVVASQGTSGLGGTAALFVAGQSGFNAPLSFSPVGVGLGDQYSGGVDVPDSSGTTILLNGGLAIQNGIVVGGARLADIAPGQAEGRVFVSRLLDRYSGFCRGESNAGPNATCGLCPCGNAPLLSPLAGGCLNSAGRSALLSASGQASVSNDTLRMRVFNATSTSFALLQSGPNALPNMLNSNCAPGSGNSPMNFDGLRCIGGGTTRHGTRSSDAAGNIGISTNAWGTPDPPASGLLAQSGAVAGQTIHFQAFYRDDPNFSCLTGQNTTNGVTVLCLP